MGVVATSGGEGNSVPFGRSKETHDLLNRNEAIFVSLDFETAGGEVGAVQLSAEISRLDLVQQQKRREGLADGPCVGTGDGPELDEEPADGAGIRHTPSNDMSA